MAAVLGVGLAVLLHDVLGSKPTPASADSAAADTPVAAPIGAEVAVNAGPSISQRLRDLKKSLPQNTSLANAFGAASSPAAAPIAQGGSFPSHLKLTGVMFVGNVHFAVINGRSLRIGEAIEGYRLVSVGRNAAKFQFGAENFTLTLAE